MYYYRICLEFFIQILCINFVKKFTLSVYTAIRVVKRKLGFHHTITMFVLLLIIQSSVITHSELDIYYRRNDFFTYRVTGTVWVRADVVNTTLIGGTGTSSFIQYLTHVYYTKEYVFTIRNLGIIKYANTSNILVRGNKLVSNIKVHYVNETIYASPQNILKGRRISYVDFITCIRDQDVDLSMIKIDDVYSSTSFEIILRHKPQDLLTIPYGTVDTYIETCCIDNLLIFLNNGLLIMVDPNYSSEYVLKNSLTYGGLLISDYVNLRYDILLRYFNGILVYGSITVYGNRSLMRIESNELKRVEVLNVSKTLYSIEIELIDTSVEEIPTWRSIRVDLAYILSSENALENGITIFILIVLPIVALYSLYRKLVRSSKKKIVKIEEQ